MAADAIRTTLVEHQRSDVDHAITPLAMALSTMTERILQLESRVIQAQSWRRRLPDMIIGAIISVLFALLAGWLG